MNSPVIAHHLSLIDKKRKSMFNNLQLIAGAAILSGASHALNVGLISDIDLHLKYDATIGPRLDANGDCMLGSGEKNAHEALLGRYGCDSPPQLVEAMFRRHRERFGKQDVLFVTGDFSAHHTSMPIENNENPNDTYALLLDSLSGVNQILAFYFPDTIILPVFG